MLTHFLQGAVGAIVWAVANITYIDLRRKGVRGFTRFAAFWVGTPTTWITLFAVREDPHARIQTLPRDDEEALFAEVRRDRELRATSKGGGDDPADSLD